MLWRSVIRSVVIWRITECRQAWKSYYGRWWADLGENTYALCYLNINGRQKTDHSVWRKAMAENCNEICRAPNAKKANKAFVPWPSTYGLSEIGVLRPYAASAIKAAGFYKNATNDAATFMLNEPTLVDLAVPLRYLLNFFTVIAKMECAQRAYRLPREQVAFDLWPTTHLT